MQNKPNLSSGQWLCIALFIGLAAVSFLFAAPAFSSEDFVLNAATLNSLTEKREAVLKMATALIGSSVAIAAIPGDATTPIATQISELSSYLIAVLAAITLEKFLLTFIAAAAFRAIIPIGLLSGAISFFEKKGIAKALAIRLIAFGLLMTFLIPAGVFLGDMIDEKFQTKDLIDEITTDIDEYDANRRKSEDSQPSSSESKNKEGLFGLLKDIPSQIADTVTNEVSADIDKLELIMRDIMETIAILVVTNCVIPILIFLCLLGIMRLFLNYTLQQVRFRSADEPEMPPALPKKRTDGED